MGRLLVLPDVDEQPAQQAVDLRVQRHEPQEAAVELDGRVKLTPFDEGLGFEQGEVELQHGLHSLIKKPPVTEVAGGFWFSP